MFQYNPMCDMVVSCDKGGMLEYWTGPKRDYKLPRGLDWEYKTDTDLYEFIKVGMVYRRNCILLCHSKLSGVVVEHIPRVRKVVGLIASRVILNTLNMVVMASVFCTQGCRVNIMTDWLVSE